MDYFADMWNAGDADFVTSYFHPEFILVTEDDTIARSEHVASIKSIGQRGGDRGVLDYTGIKVRELGDKHAVALKAILEKIQPHLNEAQPLRSFNLSDDSKVVQNAPK